MLDLQKLQTFRVVAATRSFTRAAVKLGYSSRQTTEEEPFCAELLERDRFSKIVELTKAGRRTLEYAERLLALAEETKVAVHRELRHSLR